MGTSVRFGGRGPRSAGGREESSDVDASDGDVSDDDGSEGDVRGDGRSDGDMLGECCERDDVDDSFGAPGSGSVLALCAGDGGRGTFAGDGGALRTCSGSALAWRTGDWGNGREFRT